MGTELKSFATEGERIIPPTRRPDGTMRKPVRIRAGYVAQEEVAIYQSKGTLIKNSAPLVPPGYDPETDLVKPKTKSAKKNEKRKEKKLQARSMETAATSQVDALTQQVETLKVVSEPVKQEPAQKPANEETGGKSELEKRIRALRKKIRLANESLSTSQASDKREKMEAWEKELKQLESQLNAAENLHGSPS